MSILGTIGALMAGGTIGIMTMGLVAGGKIQELEGELMKFKPTLRELENTKGPCSCEYKRTCHLSNQELTKRMGISKTACPYYYMIKNGEN